MLFLERTLASLAENLALDEALLLEADAGRSGELLASGNGPRRRSSWVRAVS